MAAVPLLVLGVVRIHGRAHGYQVRRELMAWGVAEWASVKPGSIYHALRRLLQQGQLRSAGTEQSGEGPERTLYALTEDGDAEMLRLVRRALSDSGAEPEFFGAGLCFLTCLPRQEAVALLRHREAELARAQEDLDRLRGGEVMGCKPAHIAELFTWWSGVGAASLDFTRSLADRVDAGAYTMADDPDPSFGAPPGETRHPQK